MYFAVAVYLLTQTEVTSTQERKIDQHNERYESRRSHKTASDLCLNY